MALYVIVFLGTTPDWCPNSWLGGPAVWRTNWIGARRSRYAHQSAVSRNLPSRAPHVTTSPPIETPPLS